VYHFGDRREAKMSDKTGITVDSKQIKPMQRFSDSPFSLFGAFLWGLFEGTIFFLVPDVLTTLMGLFRFRKAMLAMVISVAGSLVSAIVMYLLVVRLGQSTMIHFIGNIPFVSDRMISSVSEQLSNSGAVALVQAPWQGFPYKIYSVIAAGQGLPIWSYLLWTIPSRLERLLPTTILAGILGVVFHGSIRKRTIIWWGIYLTIWILIYAFYWTRG
jgi:hypothetical protein